MQNNTYSCTAQIRARDIVQNYRKTLRVRIRQKTCKSSAFRVALMGPYWRQLRVVAMIPKSLAACLTSMSRDRCCSACVKLGRWCECPFWVDWYYFTHFIGFLFLLNILCGRSFSFLLVVCLLEIDLFLLDECLLESESSSMDECSPESESSSMDECSPESDSSSMDECSPESDSSFLEEFLLDFALSSFWSMAIFWSRLVLAFDVVVESMRGRDAVADEACPWLWIGFALLTILLLHVLIWARHPLWYCTHLQWLIWRLFLL